MTGRPADWSPLADADPVPGDPYELAMNGRRFRETAKEIEGACKRLRSMCTDSVWDSDAGQAFRAHADGTAGKLAKATARYEAAATALGTDPGDSSPPTASRPNYSGALGHAQEVSLQARSLGQDAESRQRQALSQLNTLYDQGKPSALAGSGLTVPGAPFLDTSYVSPGRTTELQSAAADTSEEAAAKRRYNQACQDLAQAQRLLAEATGLRDTAAQCASALISNVIDHDGLGDSFWDHVTNFIDQHADFIAQVSKIAGWVATICGTLALVVGWIPVIGQVLAAVLGTIALIASVVQLIADVLLEIGGKGSLFDIALDVIAVASFGLGRAAAGAVRDSAVLARGAGLVAKFRNATRDLMFGEAWLKGGEKGLEEVLPKAWTAVNDSVGTIVKEETKAALEHGSASWPGWGGILRGFNPAGILKDGFGDIGDLRLSNLKTLLSGKAWTDVKLFIGDPEIHAALSRLNALTDVAGEPAVHTFLANVASNRNMWRLVTVPAVAVDWANHTLNWTGERDRFLHDVGLGWAT